MKESIRLKLDTAEAYNHHGLYHESLSIYSEILDEASNLDPLVLKSIEAQKSNLIDKIRQFEHKNGQKGLSTIEVSAITKNWSKEEDLEEIIGSAASFRELGLFKDALSEYTRLLGSEYPLKEYISGFFESIVETHSLTRVQDFLDKIIKEKKIDNMKVAEIKFRFGLEMEKRKHSDLAMEFFETAHKINPDLKELKEKIKDTRGTRTYNSRYAYLIEEKIVTTSQLQRALSLSKKIGKSVEFVLMENLHVNKEEIGKSLSCYYNCSFVKFDKSISVPVELLGKLKKSFLIQNTWVPLSWDMTEGVVEVLIDDPKNLEKTDNIYNLINARNIKFSVGVKEDIQSLIEHFYNDEAMDREMAVNQSNDTLSMMMDVEFEEEEEPEPEAYATLNETSSQIVRLVDQIIMTAYRKGASDIHVEPFPGAKKMSVRYRIDGVCQEVLKVPISTATGIISRLKIMSSLDIAEKRLPQDGKIKFKRKGVRPFELRLATLPTAGGYEDAVLRILADSGAMKLDEMGMSKRNLKVLKNIIAQPYGLILVVGPTGSGKTTTLHSAMGHINKPGIKIWTAEDPVEITQPGLRQVECKPKIGLDFARVMRAFLRADPDVIMIGEMRDNETASTGIEASLTGHLVLSTLHTNSAPETITRLLDMGLNPLNFSDALLGVLAQRLVRRLCKNCKEEYSPTQKEFDDIVSFYGESYFARTGITYSPDLTLYRAKGCEKCSRTGYKGRVAIHELMHGTHAIKELIKKQANTSVFFKTAADEGMTTLIQDGILKVFKGGTDLAEIRRVCVS